jgi:hypothetical protein
MIKGSHHKEKTKIKLRKANLGKHQTKKTIEKRIKALLGHSAWNIGLTKETDERLKRMSEVKKGKPNPHKGHPALDNQREKQRKSMLGKHYGKETRKKDSDAKIGKKNPAWKGGITPLMSLIRNSFKYSQWRNDVFTKNNWTCQKSGERRNLEAHHIKSFSTILRENNIKSYEEALNCNELWDINNGITFSKECHKKFHDKYGRGNNTMEQLSNFLNI